MSTFHPNNVFEKVFAGGILLKGLSGLLEFIGGLTLLFVSPTQIHSFLVFLTQRELIEDPRDFIANMLLHSTLGLDYGGRLFIIAYLWIHATIKLVAVIGILKNQLWAYPFSLITLGLLMVYQVYTMLFVQFSYGMLLLTIFDIFILWLIWREYNRVKHTLTRQATQE
ncbi:hypothetical protein A2791_00865 [Candidatus Saccharibacteria bacterium RIFCSPHIGHO2_01_FULL_46_30]|nr:MAG: hypothetical protein A2791_00865 [Candidatus Saccharibacteria bacterium RIFCSPHIGHO2_01_FULL_46_30]